MEPDSLAPTLTLAMSADGHGLGHMSRQPPRRDLSTKSRKAARIGSGARDPKARRSPPGPLGSQQEKTSRAKARMSPTTPAKPLVPAGEKNSGDAGNHPTKKHNVSQGKAAAPDRGSAGREGRQFTVANVGNKGRIFLRPSIRRANQRYQQPPSVFPATPPSTAGLDFPAHAKAAADDTSDLLSSRMIAPGDQPSPSLLANGTFLDMEPPSTQSRRRRALSDSTVAEADAGAFKVVISKPQGDSRPKTAEDLDFLESQLLQIAIPSWRLGTPRFTLGGTPMIRGSSYAPTEDIRSSTASFLRSSPGGLNSSNRNSIGARRLSSNALSHVHIASPNLLSPVQLSSPPYTTNQRLTYLATPITIEPSMYDALTLKPTCDDRSIVRFSPSGGVVTAATPARLVAEITSPSFLDYELISDFFLTFRSFIETSDLLRMLVARLRWALSRADEIGMVVRVRTFVAMRHWILNYFVDDFVTDYDLRVKFCELLNDFVQEVNQTPQTRKVQLKILAELKKCWRRVCSQFWDGPQFNTALGPEIPIVPGGIAGHRNPKLDPTFWETASSDAPRLSTVYIPRRDSRADSTFCADVSRAGHIDSVLLGERPDTPPARPHTMERLPTSPISVASLDVVSCSFPTRSMRHGPPKAGSAPGAHPVDPSSIYTPAEPTAYTPRALMGKRVRPEAAQNSVSDLEKPPRDEQTIATTRPELASKSAQKNPELFITLPFAGSLVRGNLLPPGQAFVDVALPDGLTGKRRTTTFHPSSETQMKKASGSAMSGQGMRKLMGSVRRALSARGQGTPVTAGSFLNLEPEGPRGVTANRVPGSAIVIQTQNRDSGVRSALRVDLLSAIIAEDFKKAVREESSVGDEDQHDALADTSGHMTTALAQSSLGVPLDSALRPHSDAGITTGSKSIVIVDGTLPVEQPSVPALNSSVEAFGESLLPAGAANPTPPTTPPSRDADSGAPRRSSFILSQQVHRPSLSQDPLPPFVPDLSTLGNGRPSEDRNTQPRPSEDRSTQPRPSFDVPDKSPSKTPLSQFRGHRRQQSSRSYRSKRSLAHRRWGSFQSGLAGTSTVRSFDATTVTGSMTSDAMPPPLRVLRRMPGGDLRGATNLADLDAAPLGRSRSVGSLTTYSESLRSSYLRSPVPDSDGFVDVVSSDYSQKRAELFSVGAVAERKSKDQASLFSTHSSKPAMRPSFEIEAQKLRQIPDDFDDDGGIESALLKLEGKYEKPSPRSPESQQDGTSECASHTTTPRPLSSEEYEKEKREKRKHRQQRLAEEDVSSLSSPDSPLDPEEAVTISPSGSLMPSLDARMSAAHGSRINTFLSIDSQESYNSTPLLDRGVLTDESRSKTNTRAWTDRSVLHGPNTPDGDARADFIDSDDLDAVKAISAAKADNATPSKMSGDQSFLNVDSDQESDLSSEMSDEEIETGDLAPVHPVSSQQRSASHDRHRTDTGSDNEDETTAQRSPTMTIRQALRMSPEELGVPALYDHQVFGHKPLPPTPDSIPTAALYHQALEPLTDPTGTQEALANAPRPEETASPVSAASPNFAAHLPFILAFDSEILAQQFTLIEKDALNEVEWKELIEMGWRNTNTDPRSWVDFLRNTDARGVEVVVARFNIVVKWIISEIVLTQDINERARCMVKFLHIASHCRSYRNFATMSQIAIALSSNEISRLTRTWALITPADAKTMQQIQLLVSPTKNFFNLRAEMEGGGNASHAGCIPFVGIYTHDLLFNSQRPSEIASSPMTPPLINFERYRIAAAVVKTLLRLLEESTLYQFQPIEGITERCLWMRALNDDDIRKRSESLE